jgi:hypothetical protein
MNRKRVTAVALTALLAVGLAACKGADAPDDTNNNASTPAFNAAMGNLQRPPRWHGQVRQLGIGTNPGGYYGYS